LRSLVLYLTWFGRVDDGVAVELHLDRWHRRNLQIGLLAHAIAIAENTTPAFKEQTALLGILQDIGVIALAGIEPDRYCSVFPGDPLELCERERACFGVAHPEVGAFLLGLWHLPLTIVEAVRWHHRGAPGFRSDFDQACLLHLANLLHEERECGQELIDPELLDRIGKNGRVEVWRELAYECFDG
jgi:hypothetical protein